MKSEILSCQDSMKELATSPASELVGDTPLARHLAGCPDCSRVGSVVLERERSLSHALDSLTSRADPQVITDAAILASERHGTARFVRWLLIGALGVTIWFALNSILGPMDRERKASATETIQFSCLPSQDAEKLIEPYLRSNGSVAYLPPTGFRGLTVRGTPDELATSKSLIAKVDRQLKLAKNPDCDAEVTPLPAAPPKP